MEGRFADAAGLIAENFETTRRLSPDEAVPTYASQMGQLLYEQGRMGEVEPAIRANLVRDPAGAWRAALALLLAGEGRRAEAKEHFDAVSDGLDDIPRDMSWMFAMTVRAEACALLGDPEKARRLYELLRPFAGRVVTLFTRALAGGPVAYYLGSLAVSMGCWDDAERHFEQALEEAERLGARPYAARARLRLAQALSERDRPGDAERAAAVRAGAHVVIEQMEMAAREVRVTEASR